MSARNCENGQSYGDTNFPKQKPKTDLSNSLQVEGFTPEIVRAMGTKYKMRRLDDGSYDFVLNSNED